MDNRFPTTNLTEFILFLIGVFIISLVMYGIAFGLFESIGIVYFWINELHIYNAVIITSVIIIVSSIIFILHYNSKKSKIKRKMNKKIDDEYLIKKILKSDDENYIIRYLFGLPLYTSKQHPHRRPYKYEDIIEFMHNLNNNENWDENELDKFIEDLPKDINIPNSSYKPPKQLIRKISIRDKHICQKCGKNLLDHGNKEYIEFKEPPKRWVHEGALAESNLITVCEECKFGLKKSKSTTKSRTSEGESEILNKKEVKSQNKNLKEKRVEKDNDFTPVDDLFSKTNESTENPVEKIKYAKELLDIGAINQEEYDKIKSKYIDKL